ncbi:MAG: tRNA lysidine(34) synthetase TilS [Puniceicoccales bacterium]|jgi:tRNA(Ile)-lysidine synthase|nr:tRNA lysidine(34) synthetase TilS [Puniceicoccales bacterium]
MEKIDIIERARSQVEIANDTALVSRLLSLLEQSNHKEMVCFACSGGSDSVFLVYHILEKFPNLRSRAAVLHFNHNLRSNDSDGDEDFVKVLAKNNELAFYSERMADIPKKISEETLRLRRDEFFLRAMKVFDCRVLLLGHQKNDAAETLLMRLVRASDTGGLAAPRAVTIFSNGYVKLRPLVKFSKKEIENHLRSRNIQWREDGSNRENTFFRNRVRHILLPRMQKIAPVADIFNNLATAKKNIGEADDALVFFAKKYLQGKNLCGKIEISSLVGLPVAILKKIFAKFLVTNGLRVRRTFVSHFVEKMASGVASIFSVGGGNFIKFDGKHFSVVKRNGLPDWAVENLQISENLLPNGRTLRVEKLKISENFLNDLKNVDIKTMCYATVADGEKISAKSYRPNYRYVRFGHSSERKLGDIVTEKVFPKDDRKFLPVIFVNGVGCWVPGLPVSNIFRVKTGTANALRLTYL